MGVLEDIQREYPMWSFLVKDKEIGPLLRDAVDPNKGFSPQEFQARLYQTTYFKTRSQKAREWDILYNTDRAEARRQANSYKNQIRQQAHQLGIRFTRQEIEYMAAGGLRSGISIGSPEANFAIFNFAKNRPGKFMEGAIKGQAHSVSSRARSQYYVPLSSNESHNWGLAIALGQRDEAALNQFLANKAISRYSHLKTELQAGKTMEDLFGGHRQVIAEELELAPESIDFTKGQWSQVIDMYDKNEQRHRSFTLSEARTLARQDRRFWNTSNGKALGSGLTNFMLEKFGARA